MQKITGWYYFNEPTRKCRKSKINSQRDLLNGKQVSLYNKKEARRANWESFTNWILKKYTANNW